MTSLQHLFLAVVIGSQAPSGLLSGSTDADVCADVAHRPAADVAHEPGLGVETEAHPAIDPPAINPGAVAVPVVVDVLRGRGGPRPLQGETWLGMATTDGESVTLEGPAFNGGAPVRLGPDCRPLEVQARPPQRER